MKFTADAHELLLRYLSTNGWQMEASNERASVWAIAKVEHRDEIGIPRGIQRSSFEWTDIVRRIAEAEEQTPELIAKKLDFATLDEVRFRIANDIRIGRTAPLHAGVTLLSSAFSMLRAAATTAQRPRSQIGSGFSKVGDGYVADARLAHTEEGSYIIPVLFRHEVPDLPAHAEQVAGMDEIPLETPQRRIVRTLAQSLDTFERKIVQPGKEVRHQSDLAAVVAAGGSKELFVGLQRILADESISEFDIGFGWGLSIPRAGDAPQQVSIPSVANDLVLQTISVLATSQPKPLRIVTGPIVALEHEPEDPFVRIALQSPNANGRMSRIYMTTRLDLLESLLAWIKDGVTVTAQGIVERTPGQPLRLTGVVEPMRLDDSYIKGS